MSCCLQCGGIRRKQDDGWWCSWCKVQDVDLDVKRQLQNEWER